MSQVALAPGHAREYETIYILRPNTEKDVADKVATRVTEAIKGGEGTLTAAELWGQRRLAYPIKRHHRGLYVYLKFLGRGPVVTELERQLRLADAVIRYQTIQLRSHVPTGSVEVVEDELEMDFDVPFEADEPEVTRVRELGLDLPVPERRRRHHDRDDRRDRRDAPPKEKDAKPAAEGEAAAKPAADAAAPAAKEAAPAAKEAAPEAKETEGKS